MWFTGPSAAEAHLTQGGATRARVAWRIVRGWVVKMSVLTGEIRRMMERYGTIYWMSVKLSDYLSFLDMLDHFRIHYYSF